jgi:deazaflavin-dependent oxidoreductase (nitroreductase family)
MSDHNAAIIEEFRANHGKVGGFFEGATLLILHTKGAKTGRPQTVVLNHLQDGDRFVVFGTKGGAPEDPDWVRNVLADPSPTIENGTETIPVKATMIHGPERDELYARQVELRPVFGTYPSKTSRAIPAIALEPVQLTGS